MSLPRPTLRRYQVLYEVGTGGINTRIGLSEALDIPRQNLARTLNAITELYGVRFAYVADVSQGTKQGGAVQGEMRIYDWGILDREKFIAWYKSNIEAEGND